MDVIHELTTVCLKLFHLNLHTRIDKARCYIVYIIVVTSCYVITGFETHSTAYIVMYMFIEHKVL